MIAGRAAEADKDCLTRTGAGMFFWKNMVRGRATRFEFGLATNRPFRKSSSLRVAHRRCSCKFTVVLQTEPNSCGNRPIIVFAPGGKKFCSGGWTSIIKKGTVLEEEKEHREHFWVHKVRLSLLLDSSSRRSPVLPSSSSRLSTETQRLPPFHFLHPQIRRHRRITRPSRLVYQRSRSTLTWVQSSLYD